MYLLLIFLVIIEQGFTLECNRCNADSNEDCDTTKDIIKCGKEEDLCFTLSYDNGNTNGEKKTLNNGIEKGCASRLDGCDSYCEEHRIFNNWCKVECCSSDRCNEKKRVFQNKNKRLIDSSSTKENSDSSLLRTSHFTLTISLLLSVYLLITK